MMRRHWETARGKIDGMSLRERAMTFAAAVFVTLALLDTFLLEPLLAKQKGMSAELVQQEEKQKEMRAQMQALVQAKQDDAHSPLRNRLDQLRRQLQEQEDFMQSRGDRLSDPGKIAGMLERVLKRNGNLELVALNTLPAAPLIEKPGQEGAAAQSAVAAQPEGGKRIFKHGVKITVRGSYAGLEQYLAALEKMPLQMFWGEASLSVEQYPAVTLTLTLYTLSLDETWLSV